jgi:hypothetical protein
VIAALRNTAWFAEGSGDANIAAACRPLPTQPAQTLARIGIELENGMALVFHDNALTLVVGIQYNGIQDWTTDHNRLH